MNSVFQKIVVIVLVLHGLYIQAQDSLRVVGTLPEEVFETSGLIYFNQSLITHNDSGNAPFLYELDTLTLSVKRIVRITNLVNTDWEAMTQDADYIYIGDFGNNLGMRTDLAIHRIAKTDYLSSDTVTATSIAFSYGDQIDFSNNGNSDWDAEAFFVLDNQLVVLTKQWQSQGSVAYSLPKIPGTYVANRIGAVSDIGLVTDATYDTATNTLVVLGYSNILSPFIGIVENLNPQAIFERYSQLSLGLNFVQAEGITQVNGSRFLFSSEYFSRQNPTIESASRLFSFHLKNNTPENPLEPTNPKEPENSETPTDVDDYKKKDELLIFRDNTTRQYHYSLSTTKTVYRQIIFDVLGRPVWQNVGEVKKKGIIFTSLETSIYYFTLYSEDGVIARPFAVY